MSVSIPVNGTIWERRMNKKKYSLDKYWEDKLNLRYEEEILRYKMLCNVKFPKELQRNTISIPDTVPSVNGKNI